MSASLTESEPEAASLPSADTLLSVEGLTIDYPIGGGGLFGGKRRMLRAVEDVSFELRRGETLGLVGESGSGKTTTGRAILRKVPLAGGRIVFGGEDITNYRGEDLRRLRRRMQLVFQDPYASLNPRMRVFEIVAEPLLVHGLVSRMRAAEPQVRELLELVGLPAEAMWRYPHQFSGGQRQRVGIARALSLHPDLIVADEPVSALDVSIRAQVVNLLQDLQEERGLTYLFIAHDLSVVRHISHRIAVMYAGQLVEVGTPDQIYNDPKHPYTEALLSAVPIPDPVLERTRQRIVLRGSVPNLADPPAGCRFHTRCPLVVDRCRHEAPALTERAPGHRAACWMT
jgi:oligopeptide/dipeptide ABC transporter ATP-binding protein